MDAHRTEDLRNLVARLTSLGARAVWDGDGLVSSIAMFGEQVTDRDLADLRQIPGLQQVNLTKTGISDAGMFHISKLESVEVLLLGGADVSDEGIELLGQLSNLKQLNLTMTGVSDRSMSILKQMTQLEFLWLEGTDVSDDGVGSIAEIKSLQLLDLCRSTITDTGLAHLGSLPDLEELNLSGCQELTSAGLVGLSGSQKLEWLGLDSTCIDDEGIRHVADLPLQVLSLNWTDVTDAAFVHLEQITTLVQLNLLGLASHRSALPSSANRGRIASCTIPRCLSADPGLRFRRAEVLRTSRNYQGGACRIRFTAHRIPLPHGRG